MTLNHTCSHFWLVDDFTPCSRHAILELDIPVLLVTCSVLSLLFYVIQHNVLSPDSNQLVLKLGSADVDHSNNTLTSYGSTDEVSDSHEIVDTIIDRHFDIKYVTLNSDGQPKITTKVVFRSHFERTLLALQELILLFQTAVSATPFFISSLSKEWNSITIPIARVVFWSYLLLLTTIRLFNSSTGLSLKYPNLWYHTFNLVCIFLFNSFFLFRSALLHHTLNKTSETFYITEFISVSLLFIIQGSDRFSDRPVTVYVSEGLTPSDESQSSFFSIFSFSWVGPMIMRAQKVLPTLNDIWSLKLEDNAYPTLLKFHKIKWHKSFSVNLFYQFRKLFFYQSVITTVEATLLFFPSMLLKKILEYVESPETESTSLAWLFVILMVFSSPITAALSGRSLFLGRRICTRMRAIIIGEVYSKALRRRVTSSSDEQEKPSSDTTSPASSNDTSTTESGKADSENSEKKETRDLGSIINLIAVDAFKVSEICAYLYYFVDSFVMTVIAITILYSLLGWAALAGASTIIIMMPLNYKLSMMLGNYQKSMLKVTDKRIQKLNETFQNIRIIKYFAWESKFAEQILKIRKEELRILWKRCLVWIIASFVWYVTPTIVCLVAFYCYTMIEGNALTTPIAFTSLSLFNLLRTPLDQFADMLSFVVQSKVSLDRVEEFLNENETTKYQQLVTPRDADSPEVGFQNATFSWSYGGSNDFKLRDLNIAFRKNKLNVVFGPTGSGKTSLLLALLGEMALLEGKVFLPGASPRDDLIVNAETGLTESVAYCSQTAWLLNGTIKENILFAAPYDEKRYKAAVEACSLKRDFEILAAGDKTEIGEKGITLSGGQKQRVSLARALYSNAAYVLLDDCLSAVDSHTAVHIYENCIAGDLMKNRTCILVSHNISLTIKEAAYAIIMDNGRVKIQGTIDELIQANAFDDETTASVLQSRTASSANLAGLENADNVEAVANHAHLLNSTIAALTSDQNADQLDAEPVEDDTKIDSSGKLIQEETKSEGFVSWDIYKTYLNLFGNRFVWSMLAFFFLATQLTNIYQSYWLRVWSMAENDRSSVGLDFISTASSGAYVSSVLGWDNVVNVIKSIEWNKPILKTGYNDFDVSKLSAIHSTMYYLVVYSLIGLLYSVFGSIRVILVFFGGLGVSNRMFKILLNKILRAQVRFFDSTPIGRIMNRFSKDIEGIDQELAPYAEAFVISALGCLSTIVLITIITPLFLVFGVIVSICFAYVGVLYLTLSRELKRFESITRSPINQHFTETLTGVTTIRAFGDERRFMVQNMQNIDTNNRPFFFVWVNNRWMSFRANVIGSLIVAVSSALSVLYAKHIDAGMAGISLSFAASFATSALWLLRCYADVEININAVERVQEYINDVKEESVAETENDPPFSWPEHGEIDVKDLALRYAPDLPLVIKGISFHVIPGEKVGVVGRTGAGKSTIITSFFRFIEPDKGKIVIDGVDISKIGLKALRRGLAIIPQEPTLFTGTLRSNLDMFNESRDIDIYESLRRVGLISKDEFNKLSALLESGQSVEVLHKQTEDSEENSNKFLDLEAEVAENGGNLSQGERQLICLARALLKRPKILLLDEATASIDYETDAMIQTTIREEFSASTILTIAHRLKTIIDYDKILVLDHGNAKEYDHPYNLLTKKDSQFRSMCQDTGEFDDLVRLAKEAYEAKR